MFWFFKKKSARHAAIAEELKKITAANRHKVEAEKLARIKAINAESGRILARAREEAREGHSRADFDISPALCLHKDAIVADLRAKGLQVSCGFLKDDLSLTVSW